MKKENILLLALSVTAGMLQSCRTDDEDIVKSQISQVTPPVETGHIAGFFLLNEGNMGANKCTLDYFDAQTGNYVRNIYAQANPGVVQELGDVGNDIQVYDDKLWAVINCSNMVEVMNLADARHITQISIPNCRYITFKGDYAYVSSYAGPVQIDPNARLGCVVKIDIHTLKVVGECTVGYQPEEMVVVDDRLYVANSGGYRVPYYDSTVSVIDLNTFKVTGTIDVAINLHRMKLDRQGYIWVGSRGNYYEASSKTFVIDPRTDRVCAEVELPNSNMAVAGDSLYVYGTEWNYISGDVTVTYAIVDTRTREVITRNMITDGTDRRIVIPYGIAVNPETREFYITDAGNYVSPGELYCFSPEGSLKWHERTGDVPAHFAFTPQPLSYE
ncbi:MAG: hypothetical protein NC388_04860 [Clostridium sp.]|nr:hypothetical protein [Clostridium sp.]